MLYAFRVLLTGSHVTRFGEPRAHLPALTALVTAPVCLPELIAAKADVKHARVVADIEALHTELDASQQPDASSAYDALHDFVVRARLR